MPPRRGIDGSALGSFFKDLERARKIDPQAFAGVNIPTFSDEQVDRQSRALQQAARERRGN
jgi:hypothetical protein